MPYKDPKKRKEYNRQYRNRPAVKSKLKKYLKKYGRKYEVYYNLKRRVKRWNDKIRVLNHYSNNNSTCVCCGETWPEFLTVDHIWGRGNVERKRLGIPAGSVFYAWLIKNNFPPGYQVLCLHCNLWSWGWKVCPHKRKKIRIFMETCF